MRYLLILSPLLFLFSATANATDYYYCDCQTGAAGECVAGNNSNNGTSTSTPRQTFANAHSTFNNFSAGDSIQFCRGGSFTTSANHSWVNNKCASSNVCTVTAYDMPAQQNPQLAAPIITQQSGLDLFSLADGGNADHEEGYSFSNLDLRCTGCSNSGWAFFLYNDVDYVNISNISINGFDIAVHMGGSSSPNQGSDGTQNFITINNLKITNNHRQGILGGANDLIIKNSYFENNGSGTVFDHNIYISKGDGIVIRENELYRSSLDSGGNCGGVPLVVHGIVNNLLIENNIVREDIGKATAGCWGIAVDSGWAGKPESFTNITIRGNKVINVGNLGIGIAACDTCVIESNVIIQQQPAFGFNAISAPNRSRASDDLPLTKVTIRNNSIYTSSAGRGIKLDTEGTEHVLVSNVIHYTGTGRFTCLDAGLAASAYTAINNNTCYFPNATSSSEWEAGSGTSPSAIGAWQSSGFGTNSQNVNPDFKDPTLPSADLSPLSNSSPLLGTGHSTLSSPKDYRGKTRDAQPDAGAFEYGTFNPPAKTKIYFN